MALNKIALKNGLKSLFTDMETRNENAKEELAERMANLIDAFVKSGTVTVQAGIPVSTTGTPTAQTGTTTASGTGTIN